MTAMPGLLPLLFVIAQDTTPPPVRGDAYLDLGARALVASARERREREERLVTAYEATVTQRIGVGVRALRRDRMLFRQEVAARVSWRRDSTSRVEVIGARQAVPVAVPRASVPDDIEQWGAYLAFDPTADYLRLIGQDREGFTHPLSPGSEEHYRFRSGDTTTISLPDGRTLRLVELRVEARRAEFRLMTGSLWFDASTHGMVRALFRPARPYDMELDGEPNDRAPAIFRPIRAEVQYVTIEYALYELRWWLPRFVAIDAEGSASSFMRVPVRFERVYTVHGASGGTEPPGDRRRGPFRLIGGLPEPDSVSAEEMAAIRARCAAEADSIQRAQLRSQEGARVVVRVGPVRRCVREAVRGAPDVAVVMSQDTVSLLTSEELGPPILAMGDVLSEAELERLGREIGALPGRAWQVRAIAELGPWSALRYSRYNRVEALSLGARFGFDFGRLEAEALGRIGLGDLEPNGELGIVRPGFRTRLRLAGFRRLSTANPAERPFGIFNSLAALLAGRDDGQYYRAYGVELTGHPGTASDARYEWRLYAERQSPAGVETSSSLPRLFDGTWRFRPNIQAQRADQYGASFRLGGEKAFTPVTRIGFEAQAEGATGTFEFGRGSLATRFHTTVGRVAAALETAAGTSVGDVPVQSLWYLGGPASLRGHAGGVTSGTSFWRARAELGTPLPAARLAVFTDAGWAGRRESFASARPLLGAGVGASFLDGIVRMDVSRALRAPHGWRFDIYVDGLF